MQLTKARLLLAGLLAIAPSLFATDTITVDAGFLRLNAASPALNITTGGGSLLLLVAAGGGNGKTFSNNTTTGTSYVTGGDVILGFAGLNSKGGSATNTFGSGVETTNSFIVSSALVQSAPPGAYVELRWYPSITLAQYTATTGTGASSVGPGAGAVFGAYNPLLPEVTVLSPNNRINQDSGDSWLLPGDGGAAALNFFTSDDQGGSQNPVEGYARFAVAAVPEPSTYLGVILMMVVGGWSIRRKRLQAA